MPNRRKRLLLVSALLVVAVGLVLILRPRNEPKYQGRYLSEWMEDYANRTTNVFKHEAAKQAVQKIGTNAVPVFVNWLNVETPPWKTALRQKLPRRLSRNETIGNWLGGNDVARATLGMRGISILGTNASGAIPALNSLMQTRTNTNMGRLAISALTAIGRQSIPVLKAAFADPTQPSRPRILSSIYRLSFTSYASDQCMPVIVAALGDNDANVRAMATNLLQVTSTNQLRNTMFMPARGPIDLD